MSTEDPDWRSFIRRHWGAAAMFVLAVALAFIGAAYVFLWFVGNAQSSGMVPRVLGLWTMGHLVTFILGLILREILFIGIPVIIAAVAGWLWWRKLPDDERKGYHLFGARSRATGGGGSISLLFWIAFCIKIYLDGNWNVAISTWTLDYLVYSCLTTLIWLMIIFGIPTALGIIWWIDHEMKKKP